MAEEVKEFRNRTDGFVGAVKIRKSGEEFGVSVAPGESVFLTADEEKATANAPRRPEDNPFYGPDPKLELVPDSRPLGRPTGTAPDAPAEAPAEETGQAAAPAGDAPEGEYAEAEEVGDPQAPQSTTPRGELGNITPESGKVEVPQGGVGA